jgi:hypothetical protein
MDCKTQANGVDVASTATTTTTTTTNTTTCPNHITPLAVNGVKNVVKNGRCAFKILNKIGQGGYGFVFTVEKTSGPDENTIYAMKVRKTFCDVINGVLCIFLTCIHSGNGKGRKSPLC